MKLFRYTLLGLLLFTFTTINCKAEDFDRDNWNQCIEGNWENNRYCKLTIWQSYQKNGEENDQWHHRLLYYSKYAYAFNKDNESWIHFIDRDDYKRTKTAWQKELPDYVLKRIYFYDKDLEMYFLDSNDTYCNEERENNQNIELFGYSSYFLEKAQEDFPNAKELSR